MIRVVPGAIVEEPAEKFVDTPGSDPTPPPCITRL